VVHPTGNADCARHVTVASILCLHVGMARLSWPRWLVNLPTQRSVSTLLLTELHVVLERYQYWVLASGRYFQHWYLTDTEKVLAPIFVLQESQLVQAADSDFQCFLVLCQVCHFRYGIGCLLVSVVSVSAVLALSS